MASVSASLSSFSGFSEACMSVKVPSTSNSRILDIPCKVCGDNSSGKHYNIFACDGCAGFFKRSIRRNRQYICKAKVEGSCIVDKTHRNQCRACRLAKCQEAGMNKDAVQHERGPRNSTLRKQQMALIGEAQYANPSQSTSIDLCLPRLTPSLPIGNPSAFFTSPTDLTRAPMMFPPPIFMTSLLNPAAICESAARLLFMNVHWVKNVPSFTTLTMADQLILLEESWRELFVLGVAQFLAPIDLRPLLHACELLQKEPEKGPGFLEEITKFQEIVTKIAQFHLDPTEFSCLRAIILFKIVDKKDGDEEKKMEGAVTIAAVQNHTQLVLSRYVQTVHPAQPLRLQHLLMLLPNLKCISNTTIEELFFRRTIGNIPIVRLICDMYQNPPSTST